MSQDTHSESENENLDFVGWMSDGGDYSDAGNYSDEGDHSDEGDYPDAIPAWGDEDREDKEAGYHSEEDKFDGDADEDKKKEMDKFAQQFYLFISSYALSEAEQDYYLPPRELHRKIKDYLVTLTPDQLIAILEQCFHEMGAGLSRKTFNQYLLTTASKAGFVEIVSALLETVGEDKFDITNPDDAFAMRVSLLNVLAAGESVVGNLLLAYGIQPNEPAVVSMLVRDNGDATPLMIIATQGWPPEIVRQFFLPQPSEVLNAQTRSDGQTALTLAARNGHLELVQLLVEAGVDKELKDYFGRTALMLSAEAGKSAVVSYLLKHEANSSCKARDGRTAFHFAVQEGCDVGVIRQLLPQNKEEIDAHHGCHYPALLYAAKRGDVEVVRLLLDAKADVEALQTSSITPLLEALGGGHSEVALLLLAQGADPTRAGGGVGLIRAAGGGCDHRVISALLARADNIEISFALLAAAENGNAAVVKQLLGAGANIEETGHQEMTPLMLAIHRGHPAVAELLLFHGANPLTKDGDGDTTLRKAADAGYTSLVATLLSKPGMSDILNDVLPSSGDSALMCAAKAGHLEVVRLLLEAGVDTTLPDADGKTALMLAMEKNHPDVVALLLDREKDLHHQRAALEKVFEALLSNTAKDIADRREDALNLFEHAHEDLGPDKRTPERRKKDALKMLSCLLQEGIVPRCMQSDYRFPANAVNDEFLAPFRARVLDYFQALGALERPPVNMLSDLADMSQGYVGLSVQEIKAGAAYRASVAASSTSASSTSVWSTSALAVAEHKAGQEEAALLDDGIDISALLDDGGAPLDEKDSSPQPTIGVASSSVSSSSVSSSLALPGIRLLPAPRPDVPVQSDAPVQTGAPVLPPA